MRPLRQNEKAILQKAVEEAKHVCNEHQDDIGCTLAWDAVDEVARGLDQRREDHLGDPLEAYCAEFPENDECRTYE